MTSVSITSWKPACMSLIVEENDGGDGLPVRAMDGRPECWVKEP